MSRNMPLPPPTSNEASPLVSVIICSLNGHQRISRAVESVLSQDHRHLELIVVDDGSRPSLEPVVRAFDDERLRFYRFAQNNGVYAAREFAVSQSKGEFLALLDDDDWWLPEKISRQLAVITASDAIGLVSSGAKDSYPDGAEMLRLPPGEEISYQQELVDDCIITSSVLFRRSAYEAAGGFDRSLFRFGDWDFWIRLRKKCLIKAVLFPLVVTSMRAGSLQRSGDTEALSRDRWKVVTKNREEIQRLGLWGEAASRHHHSIGVCYLRSKNFSQARQCLGHSLRHKMHLDTALAFTLALLGFSDSMWLRKIARKAKGIKRALRLA